MDTLCPPLRRMLDPPDSTEVHCRSRAPSQRTASAAHRVAIAVSEEYCHKRPGRQSDRAHCSNHLHRILCQGWPSPLRTRRCTHRGSPRCGCTTIRQHRRTERLHQHRLQHPAQSKGSKLSVSHRNSLLSAFKIANLLWPSTTVNHLAEFVQRSVRAFVFDGEGCASVG